MRGWLVLVLAGCFDPKPPLGVPCSESAPCPDDQQCIAGTCGGTALEDGPPGSEQIINGDGDTCANAIPLDVSTTTHGDLTGAKDDFNAPTACTTKHGIERVYVIELTQSRNIKLQVNAGGFDGFYYTSQSCPPTTTTTCGTINNAGSTTGATYQAGNVFLVIEQTDGTGGLTFDIVPK